MKADRAQIAVAIHDVDPATFQRVALVRTGSKTSHRLFTNRERGSWKLVTVLWR